MGTIALTTKPTKTQPKPRLAPGEALFPEDGEIEITCRACDAKEKVFVDHPALLCAACLADLAGTNKRIVEAYARAMDVFFRACEVLSHEARNDAWYAKTEAARGDMSISPELFARAWEAAGVGPHADIVRLRNQMDAAAETMRAAELRYIAAQPELAAARAAFGEPVEV